MTFSGTRMTLRVKKRIRDYMACATLLSATHYTKPTPLPSAGISDGDGGAIGDKADGYTLLLLKAIDKGLKSYLFLGN